MKRFSRNLLILRNLHSCTTLFREVPKNLKGKKHSSQLWLVRQLKDPYVEKAQKENYRCRSAYKLLEINDKFKILQPGHIVIDCGAAPGSWTQVAIKATNANAKEDGDVGTVFGIDKQPIYPIEGATLLSGMDFTDPASQNLLLKHLNDSADQVDIRWRSLISSNSAIRSGIERERESGSRQMRIGSDLETKHRKERVIPLELFVHGDWVDR
ncbi:rRNA methyltransferase 2, mitochondrial isoform X2 [Bombus affinis]|uniref:rRNA methyltransferase 2, mitochondrial isoform X2 n=1 Tax=Bombus affinis TaxID=309941 RepID=UPI0021B845B2|nr:rRNA methyltransferase 2, mitochondrial isoform X2 [Bombus affinis]